MPITEEKLISLVAQGDERAFRALYDRHQPMVFRLALGVLREPSEAREVVQEVFIRLHKLAPKWSPKAKLSTWLYRVTMQQSLNWRRSLTRFSRRRQAPKTSSVSPERQAIARQSLSMLDKKIEQLSKKQRAVVTLHLESELMPIEIAEALGISPNAARVTLHRAMKHLKAALEDEPQGGFSGLI